MSDDVILKGIGTGTDPLGRWAKNTVVEVTADVFEEAIAKGWVDPMPEPADSRAPELDTFTQHYDERGRVRLDRPLTDAEAAAVDAANRAEYVRNRVGRFTADRPAPGTPYTGEAA